MDTRLAPLHRPDSVHRHPSVSRFNVAAPTGPRFFAALRHGACLALLAWWGALGCAGPGPKLFPAAPLSIRDDGATRAYDLNDDQQADVDERLSEDGRIAIFGWTDAGVAHAVTWQGGRPFLDGQRIADAELRDLLIILDSVPFQMVLDAWNHGRFRLFPRPSRIISPFPVMTDLALDEFFGVSPAEGVEALHYNGRRLTGGLLSYARSRNSPWLASVDYRLPIIGHAVGYEDPHPWFEHELSRIQAKFIARQSGPYTGYVMGTSALGANDGRNGHQFALTQVDRLCQQLVLATAGRARITLMSDHGHYTDAVSQRIPLSEMLARLGYRVRDRLETAQDVVAPEFGSVSCGALYTRQPRRLAGDVVGIEGIELAAFLEAGEVVVLSRGGEARIARLASDGRVRWRYRPVRGDPLRLATIWASVASSADDFVDDETLFRATHAHVYPDPLARLWRAFHGLVKNTPDVLLSTAPGWYIGDRELSDKLEIAAGIHGGMSFESACGFIMSMAGPLPDVLRMEDARRALIDAGFSGGPAQR